MKTPIFNEKSTVEDLYKWISQREALIWDEYISLFNYPTNITKDLLFKWLEEGELIIRPHYGSNEGIYCDIGIRDAVTFKGKKEMRHIMTLKTLQTGRDKLMDCWSSAGRIYDALTGGF